MDLEHGPVLYKMPATIDQEILGSPLLKVVVQNGLFYENP